LSSIFHAIDDALTKGNWLIALDRDGTIVPYADRPEEARVDESLKNLIADLCALQGVTVAIISARSAAQLKGDFDGSGAILAGNYGLEVLFPDGTECIQPHALNAVPLLKTVRDDLSEKLDLDDGPILEDHGYSLCLHWQNVPIAQRDNLHAAVVSIADRFPDLIFRRLPSSYEVLPNIPWDKGSGLSFIASNAPGHTEERMHFFAGDTMADSPGFVWTNERAGISIRIGAGDNLGARFRLDTPAELHEVLEYIARRR
jgi:trehalose 6-phosphate phosphatase